MVAKDHRGLIQGNMDIQDGQDKGRKPKHGTTAGKNQTERSKPDNMDTPDQQDKNRKLKNGKNQVEERKSDNIITAGNGCDEWQLQKRRRKESVKQGNPHDGSLR